MTTYILDSLASMIYIPHLKIHGHGFFTVPTCVLVAQVESAVVAT